MYTRVTFSIAASVHLCNEKVINKMAYNMSIKMLSRALSHLAGVQKCSWELYAQNLSTIRDLFLPQTVLKQLPDK